MMVLRYSAKRFVAGKSIDQGLAVAKGLEKEGFRCAMDHLGEEHKKLKDIQKAVDEYIELLNHIKKKKLNSSISVKLSQIGLAVNKETVCRSLEKILDKAKELKIRVEIDMEKYCYVEETIEVFLKYCGKYDVLLCIQAYLHRSENDVKRILKKKGKMRLVKGTYRQNKIVALHNKDEIEWKYVKLMKLCLSKGNFLVIATHDEEIIEETLDFIRKEKINKDKFEFENLYGFSPSLSGKLVKYYPVRIYLPYGKDQKPYVKRRISELKRR